jgi:hypothetical protein
MKALTSFFPGSPGMALVFQYACVLLFLVPLAGCIAAAPEAAPDAWANPFLLTGTMIRVQVDYVPGFGPSQFALDALRTRIAEVGSNATFDLSASLQPHGSPYSPADILAVHERTYAGSASTWRDAAGQPILHVLYLDGNTTIPAGGLHLGLTPVIVVFPEQLPTQSLYVARISRGGALPGREMYERAILLHEYGHVLGLVGCGLPETRPHGADCHSTNERSVMFAEYNTSPDPVTWAVEDETAPMWHFDDDDWADIRAGQAALRFA